MTVTRISTLCATSVSLCASVVNGRSPNIHHGDTENTEVAQRSSSGGPVMLNGAVRCFS